MDDNDPISTFFPGEEDVDLYAVLSLGRDATLDAIKKAYRRHALAYHPDKHATAAEQTKEDASNKFQKIGFAYAVLSDSKRKARYDSTGRTDEGFELGAEDGWEAYFEELFDRVTRGKLDEMKKEYQSSAEEIQDLKETYNNTGGDLDEMMSYIPHSTHEDEARFIVIIMDLIKKKELKSTPSWVSSSKDEKAKMVRKKESKKEAKEAEVMAEELGVWDEFYGTGKATDKKNFRDKGKGRDVEADEGANEDLSALQALILKKKKNMDGFFDSLASKYSEPAPKKGKGKKRSHDTANEDESPKKKSRSNVPPPPEIDDEEFAKLQAKLFGDKGKPAVHTAEMKKGKGRKAK